MKKEMSRSGINIVGMDIHIKAPVGQASMKMHKGMRIGKGDK